LAAPALNLSRCKSRRRVQQNREDDQDIALLNRAAAGDSEAFHGLIDRHAPDLYRLAVRLLGNTTDAEDVLQETWVGAFKGLRRFEERASVKTWLTRILVTQAALWRRQHARRLARSDDAAGRVTESDAAKDVAMKIDLDAALHQLSDEHREVLVLREFEQMSYEEMAESLGVPRGTVESRLHRARGELREKLKGYL
jgi:RNA polymerase sigma-70 factor, ECF subfamily